MVLAPAAGAAGAAAGAAAVLAGGAAGVGSGVEPPQASAGSTPRVRTAKDLRIRRCPPERGGGPEKENVSRAGTAVKDAAARRGEGSERRCRWARPAGR